jgi:hypothetical protein
MFAEDTYNPDGGLKFFVGLDVFQEGEEYSVVTDLRRGFSKSLAKPVRDQLLTNFWDIKKPIEARESHLEINTYNPMKPVQQRSFFDYKENDEFFYRRSKNPNTDEHR